ncbi:hypothetical protein [Actinoplanes ianthinogenes]|uniref:phage terminase small subunit n=1 Tax=Actinoplanes ianthinogenes TaxID=122358 RepID=UPI00166FAA19|nr:hypothetical protein [Actinoplanes ianthinogenes]
MTDQQIVLPRDGEVRGPDLGGSRQYTDETVEWYETWRRSPQAAIFEDTDWQRLRMLAPLVDSYFRRPSKAAFEEIRLNEERLGATVVDRMRARMRIEDADDAAPAPVLRLADRADLRARLASGG